jgi:hypothetical protein
VDAVGGLEEVSLLPEVRAEVAVGLGKGEVGGLDEVTHGTGVTAGGGVDVLDTSEGKHALGSRGGDEAGTTRGGDEPDADGATVTSELVGHSVGSTDACTTPVTTTDGDDGELGEGDGGLDGVGDLRRALDTETKVAVAVTDSDEGLEAGALTGSGLLLDGHDLHDLILQDREQKSKKDGVERQLLRTNETLRLITQCEAADSPSSP